MSRLQRLEFFGAIHLTRVRGRPSEDIFFDAAILAAYRDPKLPVPDRPLAPDSLHIGKLAWSVFEECNAVVHAYCLEPNVATWLVQTFGAPLATIMRRICGAYSHYLHQQRGLPKGRSAFGGRYESRVIAPTYLAHAVRRIHGSPVDRGLVPSYTDYPFSSDRIYRREVTFRGVRTGDMRAWLAQRGLPGVEGYRKFMGEPESTYVSRLFRTGSPVDHRVIGSPAFARTARDRARRPPRLPRREHFIEAVSRILKVTPDELGAPTQAGVLGRAMVAWYATRINAATLTEVGRWFSMSGTALRIAMRRHRANRDTARLFELSLNTLLGRDIEP